MLDITNNEMLREAYKLLRFIQDDVPGVSKQRPSVGALVADTKKGIRAYNNRPASDSRIIKEYGIDGYMELVRFPDTLDKACEADAEEWFLANCYLAFSPTQYDCSGQRFTDWYKIFRRCGHWFAYHSVCVDV